MTDIDNTMSGAQATTAINARLEEIGSEVSVSNESASSVCEKLNGFFDDFDGTTELTSSMSGSGFADAVNDNFEIAEQEPPAPEVAPDPIKFLHYSDPHGTSATTSKADKILSDQTDDDYDADITFCLLTGDNGSSLDNAIRNADKGKHLLIMGNHDAHGTYQRDNHSALVSGLKSLMTQGGVIYGDESGQSAYWHKDFVLSDGNKLRLIATDEYEAGEAVYNTVITQAQVDWFIGLLQGIGVNDYVIVATHKPPFPNNAGTGVSSYRRRNKFCSCVLNDWDSNGNMGVFADILNAYTKGDVLRKTYSSPYGYVSASVDVNFSLNSDRAKVLCMLFGHVHGDYHGPHPSHNNLLIMGIDCCKASNTLGVYDETDIPAESRAAANNVLMNKVTINFEQQRITIDRIGAQDVPATTYGGIDYPAVNRDTITFGFDAQVVEDQ